MLLLAALISLVTLDPRWQTNRITDPNAVQVLGENHLRFELNPDLPELNRGQRIELTSPLRPRNNQSLKFEIWHRIPELGRKGTPQSMVLMQWHEGMPEELGFRRPPLAHRLRGERLLVTLWNDTLYALYGKQGDGMVLADVKLQANTWYRLSYQIKFNGQNGYARGTVARCGTLEICQTVKVMDSGQVGLGYDQAIHYYLKFGAYTTHKFSQSIHVEHRMSPDWIVPD